MEMCCWDAGCLEFCAGRWFGGGHDLHVLGEDGFKSLVSVDHGTEDQWLEENRNAWSLMSTIYLLAAASHSLYGTGMCVIKLLIYFLANTLHYSLDVWQCQSWKLIMVKYVTVKTRSYKLKRHLEKKSSQSLGVCS